MSKTWKWILGIVIVLVALAAVGFTVANFFGYGHMSYWRQPGFARHPMMGGDNFGDRFPMDGFRSGRYPMMGYGFFPWPLMLVGGFLRLVFPLGVLAAVGYFAYQKGKKDGMTAIVRSEPVSEEAEASE